jgi:hypothetical protein
MAQAGDYVVNYDNISVKLSDGSIIKGKINRGADFKRLSDYLKNSTDKFATIVSEDPTENLKKVFVVNKDCIVWADIE